MAARGDDLSLEDDRKHRRKADPIAQSDSGTHSPVKRKRRPPSQEIGQALRSAYDAAVKEAIPSEMLDLLGKLD
jgi:hypothetical protein